MVPSTGNFAPGFKVIDVGTGTRILAMIAASLGAEGLALDYDEVAVKVARKYSTKWISSSDYC